MVRRLIIGSYAPARLRLCRHHVSHFPSVSRSRAVRDPLPCGRGPTPTSTSTCAIRTGSALTGATDNGNAVSRGGSNPSDAKAVSTINGRFEFAFGFLFQRL